MRRLILALVTLSTWLGGCLGVGADPAPSATDLEHARPTVVALLDSGINPYHVAFGASDDRVGRLASEVGAHTLHLSSSGSFPERLEKDAPVWDALQVGQLYAFTGTRVLAISFGSTLEEPVLDTVGALGHGTGTAALVAREAPDVLILSVQIDGALCDVSDPLGYCPITPAWSEAMDWVAQQDWIDVVSVSLAIHGNPPLPGEAFPEAVRFAAATRAAAEAGKLIVVGAGNVPPPTLTSYLAGPPWVMTVGGFEAEAGGERVQAAKGVDVVANYTDLFATATSIDGYEKTGGTSLATPIVAGVLASAISSWRACAECDRSLPPQAFRDALNASAAPVSPTQWDPTKQPPRLRLDESPPLTAPVLHPLQTGWGYVDGSATERLLTLMLEGSSGAPETGAAASQAEWQRLREAYWATLGP